jgi:hypothetical protein
VTCHPCEYDDPDRCPSTVEGWACWSAAEAALRGGEMLVPHVDAAAALALAQAAGVPPVPAAELVMAVQSGMGAGLAKREGRR